MATGPVIVIVLHYRGLADTLACVGSLLAQRGVGVDVLVVDNGSGDDLAAALAGLGDVAVLRLAENQGWAGGNNRGIEWARARGAEAVCLLNNDTLVPEGSIEALAEAAAGFGRCLLHPAIDYADAAEGVQLDPTRERGARPLPGRAGLYAMDHAYGACLYVPMAVFDRIGVFDERFFLQLEETDLFERAKRAGIPALCLPAVRIVHGESRAFGGRRTPLKSYYIARNELLIAAKYPPRGRRLLRAARRLFWRAGTLAPGGEATSRWGVLRWLASGDPHARAMRRGIGDFLRRRFGRARGV